MARGGRAHARTLPWRRSESSWTASPRRSHRPSARRRSRRRATGVWRWNGVGLRSSAMITGCAGPRPRRSRWAASSGGTDGGALRKGHARRRGGRFARPDGYVTYFSVPARIAASVGPYGLPQPLARS
jgi:hypothetical protein